MRLRKILILLRTNNLKKKNNFINIHSTGFYYEFILVENLDVTKI